MAITEETRAQLRELAARYPNSRSAVMPMLHLLQSVQSEVTPEGIAACAEVLQIEPAEVTGVSTFYSMYRDEPWGRHHIGVCKNTLCGLLGGDAVLHVVQQRLGIHDGTTADGQFTVEPIECQAA